MAKYQVIVTDIGRQKMMDATVNGNKVKITHIAVGDGGGNEVVPKESWTALTREVWRGEVSSYQVDPEREDGMRVYGIIPASSGGFTIREMGVFDEAGDLIAVSSTAAMQKPSVNSGMSMDMEIYQYILLATVENVEVIIDGSVVGATMDKVKEEIEKHNADAEAHPEIKEKLDSLSDVAFSGSYSDLTNKPTIPSPVSVINNLTSTSTTSALSANQGKVLKELIDDVNSSVADLQVVKGTYTGDYSSSTGASSKTITLGFRPKVVIAAQMGLFWVQGGAAVAIDGYPANAGANILSITSTGFSVYSSSDFSESMNNPKRYNYIAFR